MSARATWPDPNTMNCWHLTARPALRFRDRLRLLFGMPLYVRFSTPDGDCHAACNLSVVVQRDWPGGDWPDDLRRWSANVTRTGNPFHIDTVADRVEERLMQRINRSAKLGRSS